MTDHLFSDSAASASMLRQWLAHDAERTATLIIWGVYSPTEGLHELQGLGRIADIKARRLDCSSDTVAREMLVEEYRRQLAIHDETAKAIRAAVLVQLRASGDQDAAAAAAARLASQAPIPPPPAIFASAIEAAIREFRFSAARWNGRGGT